MQDARIRTIYEGLKGRAGRRNLLEEFLVALHVKEPVRLSMDTGKGPMGIRRNRWGIPLTLQPAAGGMCLRILKQTPPLLNW